MAPCLMENKTKNDFSLYIGQYKDYLYYSSFFLTYQNEYNIHLAPGAIQDFILHRNVYKVRIYCSKFVELVLTNFKQ